MVGQSCGWQERTSLRSPGSGGRGPRRARRAAVTVLWDGILEVEVGEHVVPDLSQGTGQGRRGLPEGGSVATSVRAHKALREAIR